MRCLFSEDIYFSFDIFVSFKLFCKCDIFENFDALVFLSSILLPIKVPNVSAVF